MQPNQSPSQKPGGKKINLIIILILLLAAAGLLIASRFLGQERQGLTQEEIQRQISALPTAPPSSGTAAPPEPQAEAAGYLYIIRQGRLYGIEPLGEEREVTVDQGDGVVNVIHLQKDGFYMASSTCENQLCVGEGAVTLANWRQRVLGDSVYCLPHQLQLQLVVPQAQPDPDAPDI